MANKIGRNQPCPCGSGKKYKKCCLALQNKARKLMPQATGNLYESPLDRLSNEAVDKIRDGELDEAERLCHQLAKQYPEMIDSLDRFGMLHEARGENQKAAEYYRRAAEHAQTNEGFSRDEIDFFLGAARRLDPD